MNALSMHCIRVICIYQSAKRAHILRALQVLSQLSLAHVRAMSAPRASFVLIIVIAERALSTSREVIATTQRRDYLAYERSRKELSTAQ
jgi:hypothetical protein